MTPVMQPGAYTPFIKPLIVDDEYFPAYISTNHKREDVVRPLIGSTPLPFRRKLIQNALFIPEEDLYLKSTFTHDYVSYTLADGVEVSTDGGLLYLHRSRHDDQPSWRIVKWDLYEDDPFETIADMLLWGTFGRQGNARLQYRPIREFSITHLRAILKTQPDLGPLHDDVIRYWLKVKIAKKKVNT